jgi:hypothetical protein
MTQLEFDARNHFASIMFLPLCSSKLTNQCGYCGIRIRDEDE